MDTQDKINLVQELYDDIKLSTIAKSVYWEATEDWYNIVYKSVVNYLLAPRYVLAILTVFGKLATMGYRVDNLLKGLVDNLFKEGDD